MEISLENQWLCNVVVFIVVLRCGDTYSGYDSDLCGNAYCSDLCIGAFLVFCYFTLL